MTDGRVYTLEDELDVLHEDLGAARRRVHDLERAPFDGRQGDPIEWEDSLANARQRVKFLEHELAAQMSWLQPTDDGYTIRDRL